MQFFSSEIEQLKIGSMKRQVQILFLIKIIKQIYIQIF